jgi:hypothetical protein
METLQKARNQTGEWDIESRLSVSPQSAGGSTCQEKVEWIIAANRPQELNGTGSMTGS